MGMEHTRRGRNWISGVADGASAGRVSRRKGGGKHQRLKKEFRERIIEGGEVSGL